MTIKIIDENTMEYDGETFRFIHTNWDYGESNCDFDCTLCYFDPQKSNTTGACSEAPCLASYRADGRGGYFAKDNQ